MATEPSVPEEHHPRKDPGPIAEVPSQELVLEQATAREPDGGGSAQLEPDGVPPQQRMEQAYQSLVAEGKKPSGRALAERAHVHRSTCVEWLRMKQHLAPENELLPEEPERDDLSVSDEPPDAAVMELPGKALAHESASVSTVPPDDSDDGPARNGKKPRWSGKQCITRRIPRLFVTGGYTGCLEISAIPLPSDGKRDEACFSMFLWVCFQLLTIKTFFCFFTRCDGGIHSITSHQEPEPNEEQDNDDERIKGQ